MTHNINISPAHNHIIIVLLPVTDLSTHKTQYHVIALFPFPFLPKFPLLLKWKEANKWKIFEEGKGTEVSTHKVPFGRGERGDVVKNSVVHKHDH